MRTRLFVVVAALCVTGVFASAGYAAGGGNSDAAHACQHDGYLNLYRADGTGFKNTGECVSYAAQGGQFRAPLPSCTVDPANHVGCMTIDNATMPYNDGNAPAGSTITVNAVYSFDSSVTQPASVPNSLATGGGTYVIKDTSGAVIEQGTLTANDTTGTHEGLFAAYYEDSNNKATTCSAAATREVHIGASTDNALDPTLVTEAFTVTGDPSAGGAAVRDGALWGGIVGSALTIDC